MSNTGKNEGPTPVDPLLTPEQAAERLGIAPQTLSDWRVRRRNLDFIKVGKLVRYRASAIEKFIVDRTRAVPKVGSAA